MSKIIKSTEGQVYIMNDYELIDDQAVAQDLIVRLQKDIENLQTVEAAPDPAPQQEVPPTPDPASPAPADAPATDAAPTPEQAAPAVDNPIAPPAPGEAPAVPPTDIPAAATDTPAPADPGADNTTQLQ